MVIEEADRTQTFAASSENRELFQEVFGTPKKVAGIEWLVASFRAIIPIIQP